MIFDGERGKEWNESYDKRRSRLVLIGMHINVKDIEKQFYACRFSGKADQVKKMK